MGLIGTMIQTHNGGNMSPNEIKKLQYKRLKKIVEYARQNSPYFKELYSTFYKMMEKALKEGKVKSIGISNFYGERLNNLLNNAEIKHAVTQVETHPYYPQTEMKEKLNEYGTKIQAWFPLGGRGNDSVLTEDIIKELANKYGKSPAQIILRWHNQKGVIVIPGSKNPEHIKDNLNIFDFEISEEDMKKIDELNKNTPFYKQTDESLDGFAKWNPDFDSQK